MKTEDWLPFVVLAAVIGLMCAMPAIATKVDAHQRRQERAEDRRRELELWEAGRPARERAALRKHRAKYVELAEAIGGMPAPVAAAIADIDQQLADMRAEQIRKLTEETAQ